LLTHKHVVLKNIDISFTPDELRELAKQLYLGSFFTSIIDYENKAMAKDIMLNICSAGFKEAFETGGFGYGGPTEPFFFVSQELATECDPIVEIYDDDCVEEQVPYALADRDFAEQHGEIDPDIIFNTPELLEAIEIIQEKYKREFERYGVLHLRLVE